MPSTITTYYTFQPATKARSSQVNTNFSNYRGDLLPINEATATASDNTHNLGSSDHRWNTAYLTQIQFSSATTTATCIAKVDTSAAAGAFTWEIEGAEVARLNPTGFPRSSIYTLMASVTHTASTVWTCPANVNTVLIEGCGGGGGGGGAAGNNGGGGAGGGYGANSFQQLLTVVPGTVYTITVGSGGGGGAGAINNGAAGSTGGSSSFGSLITFVGGGGGTAGGTTGAAGAAGTFTIYKGIHYNPGGAGGGAGASGTAGSPSMFYGAANGGAGSGGAATGGGGGGGSSAYGLGGNGGNGSAGGGAAGSAGSAGSGYGAGGGGGGGGPAGGFAGGAGGSGSAGLIIIRYI